MTKAYLVLENGNVFEGEYFGAEGEIISEVVFTTGMTGYLETLSDKSYFGQIVIQTFPLIGNYGVINEDLEGDIIGPSAYIVKEWCEMPSNFRCEGNINNFLKERGIIGLCGIDTRALTKIIREKGVMNGAITKDPSSVNFDKIHAYAVTKAVESVSTKEKIVLENSENDLHIALIDYGYKKNIARELIKRVGKVTVCPHDITAEEIKKMNVDGIMLSNGPGDPKENKTIINNLKDLMKLNITIFGICLGHQILALANGFDTSKLKYGHRGANQPVKNTELNRVYIASHNHGYAVESSSIDEEIANELFFNVNDNTCAGIRYKKINAMSVQFHPEACGGPLDTTYLFDEFIKNIREGK